MPDSPKLKRHHIVAWGLFAGILSFYWIAAINYPIVYIWATYEDLFGEWVQFWALVATLVVSVRLAVVRWRPRWFFALLATTCAYVALEEISWGQRLFDFTSPEFFRANNLQGETNLHNFLTGPYATTLKLTLTYIIAGAIAVYGLVYPLCLRRRWRFAQWFHNRGLIAPPLYLSPFFVAGAILECGPLRFNEAEVAELLIGLGLALTAMHYAYFQRRNIEPDRVSDAIAQHSRPLAARLGLTAVAVFLLAGGTTMAVYSSPIRAARIDRRVARGIEKFAGRYARHEQWETAAMLYHKMRVTKPESTATLRRLASVYRGMGDEGRFSHYADLALEIDLDKRRNKAPSASLNRSIARTYRLVGDTARAEKHLQEALRISSRRSKKHPTSASAAYSLGQTYAMINELGPALEMLSKAHTLRPTSRKFRKAYYSAKKRVQ